MSGETRYFCSQIYTDDKEISEVQALETGSYVRAVFRGGNVDRAEVVMWKAIHHVVYYERTWPDTLLLAFHQSHYSGVPFKVSGSPVSVPGGTDFDVYEVEANGRLQRVIRRRLDRRGNPVTESFRGPEGADLGSFRYEYQAGELRRVVEVRPDGTERLEFEEDD